MTRPKGSIRGGGLCPERGAPPGRGALSGEGLKGYSKEHLHQAAANACKEKHEITSRVTENAEGVSLHGLDPGLNTNRESQMCSK